MVSTHSAGFSLNLKNQVLLVHGNLMENRGLVWKKKIRYSSFGSSKGGIGSTNSSFCCFDSSATGMKGFLLNMVLLPNMNVNNSRFRILS